MSLNSIKINLMKVLPCTCFLSWIFMRAIWFCSWIRMIWWDNLTNFRAAVADCRLYTFCFFFSSGLSMDMCRCRTFGTRLCTRHAYGTRSSGHQVWRSRFTTFTCFLPSPTVARFCYCRRGSAICSLIKTARTSLVWPTGHLCPTPLTCGAHPCPVATGT
jgi:hypothetical protein